MELKDSGGVESMESYNFLFIIAIILLSTKIFGLLSQKVHMPQVVGALLVGILLESFLPGIILFPVWGFYMKQIFCCRQRKLV